LNLFFHEFGEDLVFTLELLTQGGDRALVGGARRRALTLERTGGVLEELPLPGLEQRGSDAVPVADIGDGLTLHQVELQNRDLLVG
jgi:hypothetical protein